MPAAWLALLTSPPAMVPALLDTARGVQPDAPTQHRAEAGLTQQARTRSPLAGGDVASGDIGRATAAGSAKPLRGVGGTVQGCAFARGLSSTLGLMVCALKHEGTTSRFLSPNELYNQGEPLPGNGISAASSHPWECIATSFLVFSS